MNAVKGWASLAIAALLLGGCKPAPPAEDVAVETPIENAAETPARAVGRHQLTASPPVTVADLDRLFGLGFNADEVAAEIQRRGVLTLPEEAERERIRRLPRGERLLDLMDSPANLLTDEAVRKFGQRQAGVPSVEEWVAARNNTARTNTYPTYARADNGSAQRLTEYQKRRTALTTRLSALKKQRTGMQVRGEMTGTITMEIDRLERELNGLVPPG